MNGRLAQLVYRMDQDSHIDGTVGPKKIKVEIYHFRNQLIIGRGDHDRRCIDPVHK